MCRNSDKSPFLRDFMKVPFFTEGDSFVENVAAMKLWIRLVLNDEQVRDERAHDLKHHSYWQVDLKHNCWQMIEQYVKLCSCYLRCVVLIILDMGRCFINNFVFIFMWIPFLVVFWWLTVYYLMVLLHALYNQLASVSEMLQLICVLCRIYRLSADVAGSLMWCYKLHCVSKKVPTFSVFVTVLNINRFSEFLHCWKAYEIYYKTHTTLPTSP